MRFETPLVRGTLLRREKRFLVHVELDGDSGHGREVIAHTNNTGAMLGCNTPGSPVWLSPADSPTRKLKWTYELIESDGVLVGINTSVPNRLAVEGVEDGTVAELQGFDAIRCEVRYGEGSRIDVLLEREDGARCWVEVKNVTLVEDGTALFPDAVTARGLKHLRELTAMVAAGDRAVMLYVVQRADGMSFAPADPIDPAYGDGLREAVAAGVEVLAYRADVTTGEIRLSTPLPVRL